MDHALDVGPVLRQLRCLAAGWEECPAMVTVLMLIRMHRLVMEELGMAALARRGKA